MNLIWKLVTFLVIQNSTGSALTINAEFEIKFSKAFLAKSSL